MRIIAQIIRKYWFIQVIVVVGTLSSEGYATPEIDLLNAVKREDIQAVQYAIERGANVNVRVIGGILTGYTALMFATYRGRVDIVKLLIEQGADIHATTKLGDSALFIAITQEHANVAKLLIEQGANVHSHNRHGENPLMVAINTEKAMPEVIKSLLDHGAKVEARDKTGKTALDYAKVSGNAEIIRLLGPEMSPKSSMTNQSDGSAQIQGKAVRSNSQKTKKSDNCEIKGIIGPKGTKVCLTPDHKLYPKVDVQTSKGERWFCSKKEAQAAGWTCLRQ